MPEVEFGRGWIEVVAAPAADGVDEEERSEEAPGEEPDQVEAPVEVAGELVVVRRDAAAEEAEDVLVDEVEPEEAVAVHAAGVAQAGEDVPGGGDGEEEQGAGEGFEAAPVAVFAGEREVDDGGAEEEDEGDEAFGEDGEGEGGPHGRRRGGRDEADRRCFAMHFAVQMTAAVRMDLGSRDWRKQ